MLPDPPAAPWEPLEPQLGAVVLTNFCWISKQMAPQRISWRRSVTWPGFWSFSELAEALGAMATQTQVPDLSKVRRCRDRTRTTEEPCCHGYRRKTNISGMTTAEGGGGGKQEQAGKLHHRAVGGGSS